MEQYIDKAALVAEIDRQKIGYNVDGKHSVEYNTTRKILNILDTLEVKDINLEDSIKDTLAQKYIDYTCKRHNIDPASREGQLIYYAYMHGMNQCLNQLKAQKGE